jgi:AraC-like DNA-binding protein
VAIELTPLGARALFGMPSRELSNLAVELSDVVGRVGDELGERLQLVATWPERFAVCDDVLGRLLRDELVVVPELRRSWELLVASSGAIPIADLASEVGWTRQHLGRRFVDEFGLAPKLAGRVIRFSRARHMLQSTPSFVSIAQVAAACGYYDQAHLDRDFNEFAGCSPSRWMADEELPIFQDGEELEPASSSHG